MELNVLVAVPYRPSTCSPFLTPMKQQVAKLTYSPIEPVFFGEEVQAPQGERQAAVRNALINRHLQAYHTHVLWLDVDLVTVPADLIERLVTISTTDVVAPLVFVEKQHSHLPAGPDNGGWFYDTDGFVRNGQTVHMWNHGIVGTTEMDSVGCCYLIPADVYRRGGRYIAEGRIEHPSLMRQAREMGYRIWATDSVTVEHAYLPRYGEQWH